MSSKHILRQPKIIKPKLNTQNIIMLSIFIVGCYILYRMISSVQQQVLALKNEVVNIKLENGRSDLEIVSKGFDVSKDDVDDSQSVKSLDIDVIMQKLSSSPLEGSIKRRNLYSAALGTQESDHKEDDLDEKDDVTVTTLNEDPFEPDEAEDETEIKPAVNGDSKSIIIEDDDIAKKTIGDLRKTLKAKGLSAKGTKADLIERLKST